MTLTWSHVLQTTDLDLNELTDKVYSSAVRIIRNSYGNCPSEYISVDVILDIEYVSHDMP